MTWVCPKCRLALGRVGQALLCENKHSYDVAKQGYCNLMLVSKKNSKEPGDSSEMVAARKNFLEKGFYAAVVEKINDLLSVGQDNQEPLRILDMGCGEGYYLRSLEAGLSNQSAQYFGIDISKIAVRTASSADKTAQYAVASCFDIPLADHSVDIALSIFSPIGEQELCRVLKPKGRVIRVSPGPQHLWQLKQIIYEKPAEHALPKNLAGFKLLQQERLQQDIVLQENEDIQNLLTMTPYFWHGNIESKNYLVSQNCFKLSTDFTIQLFSLNY